ncbi:MAG: Uma2 family endonuclease [Phormidesmis sp. CAN_BIN44]|nr:Uma2 family endonuclease [Phormidesmis sp. CAN_BIN44]
MYYNLGNVNTDRSSPPVTPNAEWSHDASRRIPAMSSDLFDEYIQWEPRTKIELIDGKVIIGKSSSHSRLLLSHILRGWGLEAAIALAPEQVWWQALSIAFEAPVIQNLEDINFAAIRTWAATAEFVPDLPQFLSHWNRKRSGVRESLFMAFFQLRQQNKELGHAIGSTFVNRLGHDGLMPDILFFRNQSGTHLYDYYLEGAAAVVVEFITPGCEAHDREVKRSRYQAAGVPELWMIDAEQEEVKFLRWVDGTYEVQHPDDTGRYAVSSVPGLTFIPNRLWVPGDGEEYRENWDLFEVAENAATVARIPWGESGIDWERIPTQFSIGLEPTAIAFDDYLYWCPESKFECVDGKPWIGGKAGSRDLLGMLLMTLGVLDVIRLFSPQQWVEALIQTRLRVLKAQERKDAWWALAHRAAKLLRTEYGATRLAVAGDLLKPEPLTFWSELYLVLWEMPTDQATPTKLYAALDQLGSDPEIHLLDGDDQLYPPRQQIVETGVVDI